MQEQNHGQNHEKNHSRARLFLLLGAVGWGLSFPLVKFLRSEFTQTGLSPLEQSAAFNFIRFAITSLLYSHYLLKARIWRFNRSDWALGWRLGAFGAIALLFQVDGMAYTDPGTSAFLTQMSCVAIPVLALLTKKKKLSLFFAMGIAAGFVGLYMLSGFNIRTFTLGRGEAETMLTALFYTLQILSLDSMFAGKAAKDRLKNAEPAMATMWMFLLFSVLNIPFFSFSHLRLAEVQPPAWGWMLALVFISSLMPFSLMAKWQQHLSGTEASFIYSLESIFALLLNFSLAPLFLLYGGYTTGLDTITPVFLMGALLLLLANIFLFLEGKAKGKRKALRS